MFISITVWDEVLIKEVNSIINVKCKLNKDVFSKFLGCFLNGVYNWVDLFNKDGFDLFI